VPVHQGRWTWLPLVDKSFDNVNILVLYRSCIVKTLQCTVNFSRNLFTHIYVGKFLCYWIIRSTMRLEQRRTLPHTRSSIDCFIAAPPWKNCWLGCNMFPYVVGLMLHLSILIINHIMDLGMSFKVFVYMALSIGPFCPRKTLTWDFLFYRLFIL
jgi:hypothetical protein